MNALTPSTLAWGLIAASAVMIAIFLKNDLADYRAFKLLTETKDRQRKFRHWIFKGAAMFGGGAIAGLALLGRLPALGPGGMPAEFAPLAALAPHIDISGKIAEIALGAGLGMVIGIVILAVLLRVTKKKDAQPQTFTAGDIEPLLPRNNAERLWAILISLNAGWSEELFFRVFLPLILTLATGNVFLGFGIAVAVFGAVHLYQGATGILATAVLGALLSAIYLASGNIWIAAAVHAVIDINGLLLQPLLRKALVKSPA